MEDDLNFFQMEDDLNIFTSSRKAQYFDKWKTTLIFSSSNGRQPQHFGKWKTTSILLKMEDDINFSKMEDIFNYRKLKAT